MKASIKFREDQKPLCRAKVPLSILGLPFQSGIVAGESKELSLNLATFFESGPSIKLSYRPNDTWNPFSLIVKTGIGHFGSPISSSMLMSAEFSLLGSGNPSFMLHFKPQFGDFSIKKSQSSSVIEKRMRSLQNGTISPDDDGSIEMVDTPSLMNGGGSNRITVLPPPTAGAMAVAFSGVEIAAKTKLPVMNRAVLNFRWAVRVPAEIKSGGGGESTAMINLRKIPFLVMDKIGIERTDGDYWKAKPATVAKQGPDFGNADVVEACLAVKRQMEILQAESRLLKKAVDELREEIGGGKVIDKYREMERNGNGRKNVNGNKMERRSGDKKPMEGGASEELKKALKGAAGAGSGV